MQNRTDPQNENAAWIIAGCMKWLELFMPKTLVKRLVALILIAMNVHRFQITKLTDLKDRTVRTLQKAVKEKQPIASLLQIKGGRGRKSSLEDIESEIVCRIEEGEFQTQAQIAQMIKDDFGITVSVSTVRRLLKKNDIPKLKAGSLPAKADPKKQKAFYDDVLLPLMQKAKDGGCRVLFLDAAHFVHGCDFLGGIWGKVRRFLKTFSGRNRYNVLGALDFVTKEVITVTNETYITATEVCEMLRSIASRFPGEEIHLVLDNARYQKCKAVTEVAKELGIFMEYIPPYSPNLNLIERLWKFVKAELRTTYFSDFESFIRRIDSIIASTANENRERIESLIGEKVQLFDDLKKVSPQTFASTAKAAA